MGVDASGSRQDPQGLSNRRFGVSASAALRNALPISTGSITMRKLLSFLIALAALALGASAQAYTRKSSFDFGPAYPERIAFLMLTCKTCHGARSVAVNGVELKRDVTSGDGEVAEIWSGPLPTGIGVQEVTITGDYPLTDAVAGMGAANIPPIRPIKSVIRTLGGQSAYAVDVKDGDVVLSVSNGGGAYANSSMPPQHEVEFENLHSAGWNIERDATLSITGPSAVSVLAIYR